MKLKNLIQILELVVVVSCIQLSAASKIGLLISNKININLILFLRHSNQNLKKAYFTIIHSKT